jgi:hypothetical protein
MEKDRSSGWKTVPLEREGGYTPEFFACAGLRDIVWRMLDTADMLRETCIKDKADELETAARIAQGWIEALENGA